ncbi:DUF928 domain-containing protein [Aphanothece sacrum]|uniref:DUF928 domain-containing protein n=1 Tax=Aphanothece sacrum FPU1 TaxID=1920663 RepID=A0A401ICI5_APHSA|nr:DUF928 domain-containing protein [Aphanothece sacrum]GBF78951.1 hypothetical protein AsFPU1_0342 [Aphanothece sacrum FPU1]GBF86701.1 hypothetical protein AsFPU3_3774 [Aphanothece sacrum FPU3]
MNSIKTLKSLAIFTITLSSTVLGFFPLSLVSSSVSNAQEISLNFPPTGNRGAPKKTAGGGTRSDDISCITNQEGELPLVALMPNRDNQAKTATSTPTLYWYIPTTKATQGEFVIVDDNNQEVYQTQFTLPNRPGIIKLEITNKASLKPGKTYTWSFMIICDSSYRNRDKYIEGAIEYVKLDPQLETQIKNTSSSLAKAQLYAQSNLWNETLQAIIETRDKNLLEWQELMKSVGLEKLVDKPFIECCQIKN